jgi:hypothetical protein
MWATGFAIGSADLTGDAGTSATQNGFAPLQNDRAFLSTSATAGTTTNETLVAAEDTLLANAGADINGDIPDDHALDGSGSTDGFGSIGTYIWTVPGACQLTQPDNALSTATVACATGISGGEITLEITDVDGATASDVLSIDVGPPTTTTTTTAPNHVQLRLQRRTVRLRRRFIVCPRVDRLHLQPPGHHRHQPRYLLAR